MFNVSRVMVDTEFALYRTNEPAPDIARDYWRLQPDAKLLDVIYAVRSDESTHRFVNHSLANLNVHTDVNPFALREPDMHVKGKKTG
jgi:ubiquinol oxidase